MITLIKLVNLLKLSRLFGRVEENSNLVKPALVRLTKLVLTLLLNFLLIGWAWWYIGEAEGIGTNRWVPRGYLQHAGFAEKYAHSFFWVRGLQPVTHRSCLPSIMLIDSSFGSDL